MPRLYTQEQLLPAEDYEGDNIQPGVGARDGKDSNRFFLGKGDLKKTQSWSKEGGSTRHPHSPSACGTGKCSAWYRAELVGFPLDKWGSRSLLLTKYIGREGQHTSS